MTRTKLAKHASSKRIRENTQEEQLLNRLREFDEAAEMALSDMEITIKIDLASITNDMAEIIKKTSEKILNLTIGDLKQMEFKTFNEISDHFEKQTNPNVTISSSMTSLLDGSHSHPKHSKEDEGYLTEESNQPSAASKLPRMIGPLSSARVKGRRRSKSATPLIGGMQIKNQSILMSQKYKQTTTTCLTATSSSSGESSRISRSKFRTPALNRLKAASADRINTITPKVQLNTPVALLRYPKVGETLISMTGSPVAVIPGLNDTTANVSIPISNGVLSLRPTQMSAIDQDLIERIDLNTLKHLKQLQSNLNIIMRFAQEK